jgi:hypothetical protein
LWNWGGDVLYSSIRLDDDDAISRNFFKKLDKYLKREFAGVCISFSSGVGIILENNRVQSVHIKKYPKIAIGLTWINFYDSAKKSFFSKYPSVYNLGNHISVEERVPTLIDPEEISWARSIHRASDIYTMHLVDSYKSQPQVDVNFLEKNFGIKF